MRKIATKESEKKKQKRNNFIISLVLIVVISLSVFGIVANSFDSPGSSEKLDYNGFEFVSQGNSWILEIEEFSFVFSYPPGELDNLSVEVSELEFVPSYTSKPLYISSENSYARYEIYQNLNPLVSRIQSACMTEENCPEEFPIKSCEDNFIIIKQAENNKIFQEEGCVFIEGNYDDLLKMTDLFLYKILGIKE